MISAIQAPASLVGDPVPDDLKASTGSNPELIEPVALDNSEETLPGRLLPLRIILLLEDFVCDSKSPRLKAEDPRIQSARLLGGVSHLINSRHEF